MTIEVQKKDHIATIRFNRPEARNAMDLEHVEALAKAWMDFRDDASMRVAIITGVEKSFCCGCGSRFLDSAAHGLTGRRGRIVEG